MAWMMALSAAGQPVVIAQPFRSSRNSWKATAATIASNKPNLFSVMVVKGCTVYGCGLRYVLHRNLRRKSWFAVSLNRERTLEEFSGAADPRIANLTVGNWHGHASLEQNFT